MSHFSIDISTTCSRSDMYRQEHPRIIQCIISFLSYITLMRDIRSKIRIKACFIRPRESEVSKANINIQILRHALPSLRKRKDCSALACQFCRSRRHVIPQRDSDTFRYRIVWPIKIVCHNVCISQHHRSVSSDCRCTCQQNWRIQVCDTAQYSRILVRILRVELVPKC